MLEEEILLINSDNQMEVVLQQRQLTSMYGLEKRTLNSRFPKILAMQVAEVVKTWVVVLRLPKEINKKEFKRMSSRRQVLKSRLNSLMLTLKI